jgi:hypothetical protein
VVGLTVNFPGISSHCLKHLMSSCKPVYVEDGAEEAALAYAALESIRNKLMLGPLEQAKYRVEYITCHAIGSELTFVFNCPGNVSGIRKACSVAVSCLNPISLYTKYGENMRFLTGKPSDRGAFNFCVQKFAGGLNGKIHITAVGKVKTTKEKMTDALATISKKLVKPAMPSAKEVQKPEKHVAATATDPFPVVKCSGWAATVVADYIRSFPYGVDVDVVGAGVQVNSTTWKSTHSKIKDIDKIDTFTSRKYLKLGKDAPGVLAYHVLSQGFSSATVAAKIVHDRPSVNDLKRAIHNALK